MQPNTYTEFCDTLQLDKPPAAWSAALQMVWYDAKGDWEASHNIAQDMHDTLGSWMHAYLHRKEGDDFNAGYWYQQAGKPFPKLTLEEELKTLVIFTITKT